MKIRKFATITLLVLSSFAASNVAPSKSELEAMYDKAFREFDATNYEEALKDLDAIDARQPDLAESQNLRGVILMRQKDYPNAEKALEKALAADPKFWNARFNLAEIPFLQKNWGEARNRFQALLSGNASELQGEATQLIQYKILITYLMEGKQDMVAAMTAKLELAPETPAVNYANAAIALSKKDEPAAKAALTTAEKSFSPQLNKLFAESLYEVGWLEKPAGQTRAALELNSAADRAAKAKAYAKSKYDEAEQALQQRDLTAARKFIDEADAADPNQAAVANLRGEILLEQKEYDQAETEFRKAAKLDPKLRDAQYNLAQVPFKKKDYAKARERFEGLFAATTGADKDRAAQLIKYKVFLTYLLEGKDARAQKMMEQFQFTGDTPALYYAQAAWEFKHNNPTKANDWVTSARKIYPSVLNGLFADSFFDFGWLQSPELAASPGPALAEASPAEAAAPVFEPTPLPAISLAKNEPQKTSESPLSLAVKPESAVSGMEATTSKAEQSPAASTTITASASPSVETPVASTSSPAAARPVVATPSVEVAQKPAATVATKSVPTATPAVAAAASASPATVLAPAKVREWSQPSLTDRLGDMEANTWVWAGLLLAGIILLAWVLVPMLRRRPAHDSIPRSFAPAGGPSVDAMGSDETTEELVDPSHLSGGPPKISLQLRASEPSLRRAIMPLGKGSRQFGSGSGNGHGNGHGNGQATPVVSAPAPVVAEAEHEFSEGVGEPQPGAVLEAVHVESPQAEEAIEEVASFAEPAAEPFVETASSFAATEEIREEMPIAEAAPIWETVQETHEEISEPVVAEIEPVTIEAEPVMAEAEPVFESNAKALEPEQEFFVEPEAAIEEPAEPIGQGQPIPYLAAVSHEELPVEELPAETTSEEPFLAGAIAATGLAGMDAVHHPVEPFSVAPDQPEAQQQSTLSIMSTPTQPTPAPVIRTGSGAPMTGTMPQPVTTAQPGGGMHTAVQLTFSTEIASLQLTPSFKMGALQLKPTSRIVTMRLAPSQNPQPMNLQVTFEIANVQLSGNSIGTIRLTPSQQQRPGITNSPTFNIAGLQIVAGSDPAPVQLTPSHQAQASVHATGAFQIATVEFSPAFEIASIVLNCTSKNMTVQLPSASGSPDSAPVFEVSNVQLGGSGEIGMMQLTPQHSGPKAG